VNMKISLIVAMDHKGVIGRDGALPWHISSDLKHFKALTLGRPIIMGRKTHESIGRPLPGRENIVLTRDRDYMSDGCIVCHSLDTALAHCAGAEEVIVIGGDRVYRETIDRADCIYLTEVHADVMGDTFFPAFDRTEWSEAGREDFAAGEKDEYPFSFVVLNRK